MAIQLRCTSKSVLWYAGNSNSLIPVAMATRAIAVRPDAMARNDRSGDRKACLSTWPHPPRSQHAIPAFVYGTGSCEISSTSDHD